MSSTPSERRHNDPTSRRYMSHALVEVRRFKYLPFFCYSGVLLDLSLGGFKLEFTQAVELQPGSQYWLNIPLSPLGIFVPPKLLIRGECRWFDRERFRIGGIFVEADKSQTMIIEQIIYALSQQSSSLRYTKKPATEPA